MIKEIDTHNKYLRILICPLQDESGFASVQLTSNENSELKKIENTVRKREYMSIRKLLRFSGIKTEISYKGKCPILLSEDIHISISHNKTHVAIALGKFRCGLDIEIISKRVLRVRNKFLSTSELKTSENDIFINCLYWSAKESIYKWDNSLINFKEDILLNKPNITNNTVLATCNKTVNQIVHYLVLGDQVITWLI
jgi:phosphopantetheinyl transferase (holo-ACP synthase)